MKMRFRSFVALAALLALSPLAHADLLWGYTYGGGGVSGAGYLTTSSTPAAGSYAIHGISGTENGASIRSLNAPGVYLTSGGGVLTSDNLLKPVAPQLDIDGFTFATAADLHNIYYTGGSYYDLAGADCVAANCGNPGHLGTAIGFTATLLPSIEWTFAYSGAGVSGSGVLTTLTTPGTGGGYQVVGLSGTQNGVAMNALLPAGVYLTSGGGILTSDNLLFDGSPYLDVDGFTFNANAELFNIYAKGGAFYDLAGAACVAANCGDPAHLGTPISFSIERAVPEPPMLPLIAAAMLAMAVVTRRRSPRRIG